MHRVVVQLLESMQLLRSAGQFSGSLAEGALPFAEYPTCHWQAGVVQLAWQRTACY
jgi:hypothetical protein